MYDSYMEIADMSSGQARARFARQVDRVAHAGDVIFITKPGRGRVAAIVPVTMAEAAIDANAPVPAVPGTPYELATLLHERDQLIKAALAAGADDAWTVLAEYVAARPELAAALVDELAAGQMRGGRIGPALEDGELA